MQAGSVAGRVAREPTVTGSSLIPIVVPIVAFVGMFTWLGLVFHADSHPGWKPRRRPARASASTRADGGVELPCPDATDVVSEPERGRARGEARVGAGR